VKSIPRKSLLVAAAVVIFGLAAAAYFLRPSSGDGPPARRSAGPYNVVIVVADALRQDALGCYGGEANTPNLDALARAGVLFENAYATSPWTTPSSVSMFTGNHATSYGCSDPSQASSENLMRIFVPHSELLLMEVLKQSGYASTTVVENGNAEIHNNLQGLDPVMEKGTVREFMPPHLQAQITGITRTKLNRSKAYLNAFVFLKQILNMPPQSNFVALYWMLDPHQPYIPIDKYKSKIVVDPSKLSKPLDYFEGRILDATDFNADDKRYTKALYNAEIESADERVGCVLRMLAHRGMLQNTIIVFTSDHGEQFGDHGLWGHGGMGRNCHYYDGLMRVPLILSGPGIPRGKRITANASLLDLMPTLKELLGVDYENDMQGRSLVAAMRSESGEARSLYFDDVQEHTQVDALTRTKSAADVRRNLEDPEDEQGKTDAQHRRHR
jgi:arylsulfatase A-like enzyme